MMMLQGINKHHCCMNQIALLQSQPVYNDHKTELMIPHLLATPVNSTGRKFRFELEFQSPRARYHELLSS